MENIKDTFQKLLQKNNRNAEFNNLMTQVYQDSEVQQFLAANKGDLSEDAIERGSSKLYEFVTERDKTKKDRNVMLPGYKPELVVSNHLIDIEYQLIKTQKNSEARLIRAIGNMTPYQNATISEYYQEDEREEAYIKILKFTTDYLAGSDRTVRGLYLYGSFGVGKTYLLVAMLNDLARQNMSSMFVHYPTLATDLKNSIGSSNTEKIVSQLKKAKILVLDDIGAESNNSWLRDDILSVVLEYRMQQGLPTFFTSNMDLKALEDHFDQNSRNESEPLKAKRLLERIKSLADPIKMVGQNHRY